MSVRSILGLVISLSVLLAADAGSAPVAVNGANAAFGYLQTVMDQYHNKFYVYEDSDSGGNHYYPTLWYNGSNNMSMSYGCSDNPDSLKTCIKIEWDGKGGANSEFWNGVVFIDQPLSGPLPSKVGAEQGMGFDLRGATKLTGRIKVSKPGTKLKILVGHIALDKCGEISQWTNALSGKWEDFTIDLSKRDLSNVFAGFGIVFDNRHTPNPGTGVEIFIDSVSFDLARPETPRLLRSFSPHATRNDGIMVNASFTYDNALAILAFSAKGELDDIRRAKIIGDCLVSCQERDTFADGRLRNGYMCGDTILHPAAKQNEAPRLPAIWDEAANESRGDYFCASTNSGNMAWAAISLIGLYERTNDNKYLQSAIKLCDWVARNCKDTNGPGGFTGGFEGWEKSGKDLNGQNKATFKSTEMNLDLIVAYARLYKQTKGAKYLELSKHARGFVEKMFVDGRFVTGTKDDGVTPALEPLPMDTNAWAVLVLGANENTRQAMRWAEENCRSMGCGDGFDFNNDKDGVWAEGTGQMITAFQAIGEGEKAARYLTELRRLQTTSDTRNNGGVLAASKDDLSTGFTTTAIKADGTLGTYPWRYHRQESVAGTAWLIFAELGHNPFWQIPTSQSVPKVE